jgi:hypothetical protein
VVAVVVAPKPLEELADPVSSGALTVAEACLVPAALAAQRGIRATAAGAVAGAAADITEVAAGAPATTGLRIQL